MIRVAMLIGFVTVITLLLGLIIIRMMNFDRDDMMKRYMELKTRQEYYGLNRREQRELDELRDILDIDSEK